MNESLHAQLSRRESQIMNVVYEKGEATAEQIRQALPDPPSNSSVRKLLKILEDKGHLTHRQEGRRFVYEPTVPPEEARQSALQHIVNTFFGDSVREAVAALLDVSEGKLSEEDVEHLQELIQQAKKEGH